MKIIAMIPARLGSQRLKQKNLREIDGVPLITRAIRKCKAAECFSEVWVNSESLVFEEIAKAEGANFHHRPENLGDNNATSEDFVFEFLEKNECDYLVQVHSIAPLLSQEEVKSFTETFVDSEHDVLLSCIHDQIECAYDGAPINFNFSEKTNSQDLKPVERITWSITGWKKSVFTDAKRNGQCATYSGSVGFYPVSSISGHVIKTQEDLDIAEALLKVIEK